MVSIIIPVYNVEDYIVKCLTSVSEQTFQGAMECLIIDDSGQDGSMRMAEEFVQEYQGDIDFRIIHHKQNKGLSGARNTGIREARGEWLYFLDSDDWIISECIELMMKQVEKHPDVECVFAGARSNVDGYEKWMSIVQKELPLYSNDKEWIKRTMLQRIPLSMTAWNRLVRRDFIFSKKLFFFEGIIHEDDAWNFLLASHLNSICVCKHDTYFYLVRNDSIMSKKRMDENDDFNSYKGCLDYVFGLLMRTRDVEGIIAVWTFLRQFYPKISFKNQLFARLYEIRLGCLSIHTVGLFLFLDAVLPKRFSDFSIISRIINRGVSYNT